MKIFFILFLIISQRSFSQPDKEWVQRYNGPGNSFDIVSDLIIGNNNDLFVYGNSSGEGTQLDFVIINYELNGKIKWTSTFNGSGNITDQLNAACLDHQNNSYVTGFTSDSTFKINLTTAKNDSAGNLIWMQEFREPGISSGSGQDIALDNSGNVYVCGAVRDSLSGRHSMIVLKYSVSGDLLNRIIYNTPGSIETSSLKIKITSTDNIVIAGSSKPTLNNTDMLLVYFENFPDILWTKTISGDSSEDDAIADMDLDAENNIYICGSIRNSMNPPDYYYAKYNSDGIKYWEGNYNVPGNYSDIPSSLKVDGSGNVYITGFSRSTPAAGSEDILTVKISSSGNLIWSNLYNGPGNGIDQGNSVAVDNAGNVYVGGGSDRGNIEIIYALLKYNSSGDQMWVENYSYGVVTEDFIYKVRLDQVNNIYVTGISVGKGTSFDFATIKYSQTIGINSNNASLIQGFYLNQNYPNPFNPETVINYELRVTEFIKLNVYDILGNEVATLVNETKPAGIYSVTFDGSNLSSGIYFYKLEVDGNTVTRRMLLLK